MEKPVPVSDSAPNRTLEKAVSHRPGSMPCHGAGARHRNRQQHTWHRLFTAVRESQPFSENTTDDRTDIVLTTARFGEPIGWRQAPLFTVMARYPQQVEMARHLGADEVLPGGDAYEEVARITEGQLYAGSLGNKVLLGGYDVAYDIVGSGQTIKDSLRWARAGGTVVVGIAPRLLKTDLGPVWHQEVTLAGNALTRSKYPY
jgi:hypothetical protein